MQQNKFPKVNTGVMEMRTKMLVGALVAAGVIGGGAAVWHGQFEAPITSAHAATAPATGVAAPAANPGATTLPLNGFTDLVKKYGPAVVNISVEGTRKVAANDEDEDDDGQSQQVPQLPPEIQKFFRGFGGNGRGMPQMPHGGAIPMRGQGSGFIVSPDGYILTNAHVVNDADRVTVRLTDRREYRAKVIGKDRQTDVALIKIDAKDLPTVKLGTSRDANVGEWVVAIGSPFGFDNSVTAGIVSAKGRSLPDSSYVPMIQTDVAVNPGNSGGPLFNLSGEVIGINSQIYSRTGAFAGISFAVPIETALNVKDQILKHGKVSHGRIGVVVQEVNAGLAESFGLDRPRGALVASVEPNSPGEKAGLQSGDIILKYDGQPIERSGDLPVIVGGQPAGHSAQVEVWRNHGTKTLSIATSEGNREMKEARADKSAAHGKLGLAVRPLSPQERSELKSKNGVLVEEVSGPAERAGVQPGDVVLSINGAPVKSPEDLRTQVAKSGKNAALLIQREDRQLFVPVEIG
jgi:serine protease Do